MESSGRIWRLFEPSPLFVLSNAFNVSESSHGVDHLVGDAEQRFICINRFEVISTIYSVVIIEPTLYRFIGEKISCGGGNRSNPWTDLHFWVVCSKDEMFRTTRMRFNRSRRKRSDGRRNDVK